MSDQLPAGLEHVRTTETFDHEHHPAGLRRAHRLADGVWAWLVVYSGELAFIFEDDPDHATLVPAGETFVIERTRYVGPHDLPL